MVSDCQCLKFPYELPGILTLPSQVFCFMSICSVSCLISVDGHNVHDIMTGLTISNLITGLVLPVSLVYSMLDRHYVDKKRSIGGLDVHTESVRVNLHLRSLILSKGFSAYKAFYMQCSPLELFSTLEKQATKACKPICMFPTANHLQL